MYKFFQVLGLVIMAFGCFGFFFEASDQTPILSQLLLWLGCLSVILIGYGLYRAFGGRFKIRENFISYDSWK